MPLARDAKQHHGRIKKKQTLLQRWQSMMHSDRTQPCSKMGLARDGDRSGHHVCRVALTPNGMPQWAEKTIVIARSYEEAAKRLSRQKLAPTPPTQSPCKLFAGRKGKALQQFQQAKSGGAHIRQRLLVRSGEHGGGLILSLTNMQYRTVRADTLPCLLVFLFENLLTAKQRLKTLHQFYKTTKQCAMCTPNERTFSRDFTSTFMRHLLKSHTPQLGKTVINCLEDGDVPGILAWGGGT